jgi:RNA polymerase-binding transcription factor DksA
MSTPDLTAIRAELELERADLTTRLAELTNDGALAPDFDENFADSAQVTAEQVENLTLAATLRDQLKDVESALGRIDEGSYGRCETCGKPVSEARLEAMPAARFCIDHA